MHQEDNISAYVALFLLQTQRDAHPSLLDYQLDLWFSWEFFVSVVLGVQDEYKLIKSLDQATDICSIYQLYNIV